MRISTPESPLRGAVGRLVVLVVVVACTAAPAAAQVQPEADEILRAMGDHLARARAFSFDALVVYDTFAESGQEIQYGASIAVTVRRPDGLHVEYDGDERRHRVFYNGSTMTLHDLETNLYAVTQAPPEIGAAIDFMVDNYGVSVPISDFVFPNAYDVLIENVVSGRVVGRHSIDGVPCHHLAFEQEVLDWQIWIEDGPQPLPRKLAITYKSEAGAPLYGARMTNWKLDVPISDYYFEFRARDGASRVEFLTSPSDEPDGEGVDR